MRIIFTLIFLIRFVTLQAQSLTFNQLVKLQNNDLDYAQSFLSGIGWKYYGNSPDGKPISFWRKGTERLWYANAFYGTRITYAFDSYNFQNKIKANILLDGYIKINVKSLQNRIEVAYAKERIVGPSIVGKVVALGSFDATNKYKFDVTLFESEDYYNTYLPTAH